MWGGLQNIANNLAAAGSGEEEVEDGWDDADEFDDDDDLDDDNVETEESELEPSTDREEP